MTQLLDTLKHVVDNSSQLSAWALAVFGGSVAAILSTSYRRPNALWLRLPYLLFLPAWGFLGHSLYTGDALSRAYLAALMVNEIKVSTIASNINNLFSAQRASLLWALVFFSLWLVAFLLEWIFTDRIHTREKK